MKRQVSAATALHWSSSVPSQLLKLAVAPANLYHLRSMLTVEGLDVHAELVVYFYFNIAGVFSLLLFFHFA